jgi:outer membrane protein
LTDIQQLREKAKMKRGLLWSGLAGVATLLAAPVHGADLLSVYDQALVNDPLIREAEATRRATHEAKPQAIGALLPQASGSAGRSRQWSDGTGFNQFSFAGDPVPRVSDSSGNSINNTDQWGITIRQNVFSWANWVNLRMANHEVAQSEADYLTALQSLAQRVAQQYFAVLQAQDTVKANEAARDAVALQLQQSERRFEVGLIAITDVQETRAERDNAAAAVIAAKRALSSAEEQLRATIGEIPGGLNEPGEDMPLQSPNPASEDDWVRAAMEQNSALISSRLAADIARDQVRGAFSGHLPTIDVVAGRTYSDADGRRITSVVGGQNTASASETYGKSLALQITMPIFSGGVTQSRVRESQFRWIAAKERLERTSRTTERNARDAYLGVISEIARVQALKQALESSRTALAATEAGYEVGTRTTVDVLTSRRLLIQAQTNYSAAKYSYLNNTIQLRLAAGDLDRSVVEQINRMLTVPSVRPSTQPVAPAAQQ